MHAPTPRAARRPRRASLLGIGPVALALALYAAAPARADDRPLMPARVPAAYTQECAACHTAYAPALLPAASWQRIVDGLDRHYGSDASVDAATAREIGAFLQANAGNTRRVRAAPPQDRITRSAWFERKHRGIGAAVWRHPGVVSAAQCGACHRGADRGDFDDDALIAPAGLDLRLLHAWRD
jgi:mono/diheme cytochrome c family protein